MPKSLLPALIVGLSLALMGAGCGKAARSPEVPSAPQVPAALELSTMSHIATSTMPDCEFNIEYPEVVGGTSPDAAAAINADIEAAFRPASSTATGEDLLKFLGKTFMDGCERDIAAIRKKFPKSESAEGWYEDDGAIVHLNDGRLLSVELMSYTYTGGAHPNYSSKFLLFDARTGRRLRMGDILRRGSLQAYNRLEKQAVLKVAGDLLFPEARNAFTKAASSTADLGEKELAAVASRDNFYLDGQTGDWAVIFGPYEIAPFSAGDIEGRLPLADLKDIIDPAGPAGHLLK